MSGYYPDEYYSKQIKKTYSENVFLSALRAFRLDLTLRHSPLARLFRAPHLPDWIDFLAINSKSRILDVGCGIGQRLLNLRKKGFHHLHGVEPFIDTDIHYPSGVVVFNTQLTEFAQRKDHQASYDVIMMHHSLEHMPDQHSAFTAARKLIKPTGALLIRIPVCSSFAWEHYRENWVQLDAPRHLHLHSTKSIEKLGSQYGFALTERYFDSNEFQFTGSELYIRNIPLVEGNKNLPFSAEQIKDFQSRADELNKQERGDQAVFVFRPVISN